MANASLPDFILYQSHAKTVSTNSEIVIRENGRRRYLLIQNVGSQTAYLAFGTTRGPLASSTTGIQLAAGESYEMSMGSQNVNSEAVYATSRATSTSILITEGAYVGEFASLRPPPAGASSSSSSSPSSASSSSSSSST